MAQTGALFGWVTVTDFVIESLATESVCVTLRVTLYVLGALYRWLPVWDDPWVELSPQSKSYAQVLPAGQNDADPSTFTVNPLTEYPKFAVGFCRCMFTA
jgi:hypothetical protein